MKITQMNNTELLMHFKSVCARFTNYPNNKSIAKDFQRTESEIAKRLGVDPKELNK